MGLKEVERAAINPMLEVKRVPLDDGLHASLILENGCISKLVLPSGEVAVLKWEGKQDSPRPSSSEKCTTAGPRLSPRGRHPGPQGGFVAARHFWASKSVGGTREQTGGEISTGRSRGSSAHGSDSGPARPDAPAQEHKRPHIDESAPETLFVDPAADADCVSEKGAAEIERAAEAEQARRCRNSLTEGPEEALALGSEHIEPLPALAESRARASWPHVHPAAESSGTLSEPGEADEAGLNGPEGCITAGSPEDALSQPGQHNEAHHAAAGELEDASHNDNGIVDNFYRSSQHDSDAGSETLEQPEKAHQHGSQAADRLEDLTHQHADVQTPGKDSEHCAEEDARQGEPGEASQHGSEDAVTQLDVMEEASQHGSEEDDRLEELMGAAPTINLRELRTQVASLPEILSRAQRTAELCARGAPGSAHSIADGSIHSWVAQSRATAIMQQRGRLLLPRQPHSLGSEAGQLLGQADAGRRGSMEGSPLKATAQAAEAGDSRHGMPHGRLTARRSLAEVRAAIGIEGVQEDKTEEYLPSKTPVQKALQVRPAAMKPATLVKQTSIQATSPAGGSVWGKLISVFPGRRVRPESAGAQSRVSTAASAQTGRAPQRPMTERLFGAKGRQRQSERSLKNTRTQGGHSASLSRTTTGIPQQEATEAAAPATEADNEDQAVLARACMAEAAARKERMLSSSMSVPCPKEKSLRSTGKVRRHHIKATQNRTGMAGRWHLDASGEWLAGAQQVEELLDLPLLQRLAQQRAQEIQIAETDDTFEFIQTIPLNGNGAKIVRRTAYPKSGKMVETGRMDAREGALRSQLTISPEGHCHMRSLQGEPYAAVFHRRIKMSSGGHRLKIEQKFQLLSPGVMPVQYHSIWHRVEDAPVPTSVDAAVLDSQEPLLAM